MRYVHEPHAPRKLRALPWPFCRFCGLLYLHNAETSLAIKLGCNWRDHPEARPATQPAMVTK